MNGLGLGCVVVDGAGPMQVHIVHGRRLDARVEERALHGLCRPGAFGVRPRGMVGIATQAGPGKPCKDLPALGIGFEHEKARTFTHGHARTIGVERRAAFGSEQLECPEPMEGEAA